MAYLGGAGGLGRCAAKVEGCMASAAAARGAVVRGMAFGG